MIILAEKTIDFYNLVGKLDKIQSLHPNPTIVPKHVKNTYGK
jgi:hypothetical protein